MINYILQSFKNRKKKYKKKIPNLLKTFYSNFFLKFTDKMNILNFLNMYLKDNFLILQGKNDNINFKNFNCSTDAN